MEVRKLKVDKDGEASNGSVPDSLGGKYFLHENGKLYKLFSKYEKAVAHFRGYYPRGKEEAVDEVVYVEGAPTQDGEVPESIRLEKEAESSKK